jgi:cyclopropane fatty-acyl-phospholipid synthase-like methyltransferase
LKFENLPGRKYIAGCDTFIRHRIVAELASKFNPRTILDVGGEGTLKLFLPRVQITSANVKSADISYSGDKLPLKDNSFDIVVSLDTMEHLANHKRTDFLYELYRVSRKGFILCAPLGTPEHVAYEKEVLASGLVTGDSYKYLAEHVKYGLPTPDEVSEMVRLFSAQVFYQGDFRKVKPSKNRYMYFQLLAQTAGNMLVNAFWQDSKYYRLSFTQYTNRFFLIANKICDGYEIKNRG